MKLNEERRANIKEKELLKQELVGFFFCYFLFYVDVILHELCFPYQYS